MLEWHKTLLMPKNVHISKESKVWTWVLHWTEGDTAYLTLQSGVETGKQLWERIKPIIIYSQLAPPPPPKKPSWLKRSSLDQPFLTQVKNAILTPPTFEI